MNRFIVGRKGMFEEQNRLCQPGSAVEYTQDAWFSHALSLLFGKESLKNVFRSLARTRSVGRASEMFSKVKQVE